MRYLIVLTFALVCASRCQWRPTVRASNETVVRVLFALPYANEEQSDTLFQALANPDSPDYRKFMSAQEVKALVAPTFDSRRAVQEFLQANYSDSPVKWSTWGHFVHFALTVQQVEEMLGTECFVYEYACGSTRRTTVKTVDDSFPEFVLSKHLAYVGGVTQLPIVRPRPKVMRKPREEVNETDLSFSELRQLYPVPQEDATRSAFNPVLSFVVDKKARFIVTVVCPDGVPMGESSSCRDGSKLDSITLRSARASDPQRSASYSGSSCGLLYNTYMCLFMVQLENNWERNAFGFDFLFDSGSTYTYNLQYFVVGTTPKNADFVKRFYSVPANLSATNSSSYQAIGALTLSSDKESTGFYSPADLSMLYSLFDIPAGNVHNVDFKGTINDPSKPDVETSLDIQWITAMAPGARSSVWHSPASDGESLEAIVSQIQDAGEQAPRVLSLSYGGVEQAMPLSVLTQHEAGFKSLGLMGITVLVASGDTGPYWDSCDRGFLPIYPASSQYVTSVGATQLVVENLHNSCKVEEAACSVLTGASITSGGGFSASIPRPVWQSEAVEEYLLGQLPNEKFDRTKRAYPDISLFGRLFTIVNELNDSWVDGTSASAPTLAGFITLINDMRFNEGLGPVGPLNPTLYSLRKTNPESFNDVVTGFNGCTRDECCQQGFYARAGWDAATGLGTPVFNLFAQALGAPVNGSWKPIAFPDDLDCGVPLIQPNKENGWRSTKIWVVVVAVLVGVLGVAAIVAVWYYKQRQVHPAQLQEGLV